jgi:hypothetical protein
MPTTIFYPQRRRRPVVPPAQGHGNPQLGPPLALNLVDHVAYRVTGVKGGMPVDYTQGGIVKNGCISLPLLSIIR